MRSGTRAHRPAETVSEPNPIIRGAGGARVSEDPGAQRENRNSRAGNRPSGAPTSSTGLTDCIGPAGVAENEDGTLYQGGEGDGFGSELSYSDRRSGTHVIRSLRFWLSVAISAALIVLFLRATHPHQIESALQNANYWFIIPAVAVLFAAVIVRCIRWSILMRPVAPLSPWRLVPYAIIGYMANNLLPARAGEVVRAYVLGDREKVSAVGTFGTIAVARLFDGCVLVLMLVIAGSIVGFGDPTLRIIAAASAGLFVVALGLFYWLTGSEDRARRVIGGMLRFFPRRFERRARPVTDVLAGSLRSVHDARSVGLVVLFSGLAWTMEVGSYAVVGLGFHLGVGFGQYCMLVAASNLAIIIPTFFGGTGPFEWASRLVLLGAGVSSSVASAYAVVAHAVVLIPTTIVGLVLLWSFGFSFRRISQINADEVEAAS